jgi:uncharacterized DUF497 family protein
MRIEWNEAKRRQNIDKHIIDFIDVALSLEGELHDRYRSDQKGETSYVGRVDVEGRHVAVVFALIDGGIRIISARKWKSRDARRIRELHD